MIKNIQIYQLIDSRNMGGIESHILHLSKWLTDKGLNTEVVFLKDYGFHPLLHLLTEQGVKFRFLASPTELIQLIKHTPALLCTHGYKAGIIGRCLSFFCKNKVISTYHSGDIGTGKVKLYSWLDRSTAFLADDVISVSTEIADTLSIKSSVIANFVPKQAMLPTRGKAIAFVGRLSEEKDPLCFGRITKNINVPCHVYGDGPLKDSLIAEHPHLHIMGHKNMSDHWHNIGLLCITSKFEGLPLVALEAMIRGIPVISYSVGGLPDLIIHEKNGWLIPYGNELLFSEYITKWIKKSVEDKNINSIHAHHHIIKNYCNETICPEILKIYEIAYSRRYAA